MSRQRKSMDCIKNKTKRRYYEKMLFTLLIAFIFFIFYGCGKSNSNPNPSSTVWMFNGNTYQGVTTYYDTTGNFPTLRGRDLHGNSVYLIFNSHPSNNSIYTIVEQVIDSARTGPLVTISLSDSLFYSNYISTGKAGDKVNVTIINGDLHAVFSNTTITDNTEITTVTGTVIQNSP